MGEAGVERSLTVVRRVCEAWAELERDEFHQLFDAQVDYRNVPIDGDCHIGPDAICDVLSRLRRSWDLELRVDNIVGDDRVVMAERLEKFRHRAGTKDPFDLPVMGTFELRDGRITAWRDYFDLSQLRLR
jgi:limonene-1,2-epoxide hydrolase